MDACEPVRSAVLSGAVQGGKEVAWRGSLPCCYDENGSTRTKSVGGLVTAFSYNSKDRLEQVNIPGDGPDVATYKYDPFGRRISKTVDGVVTYFMYSDEGLAAEMDSAGVVTKTYGWRPDGTWGTDPVFMVAGGAAYYYHNDHLGTPQKMTDGAGAVVWSAEYTVFGKAVVSSESSVTNNLRFPGQYFDVETGLHYNFHRYYDSETGRYVTADPIGLRGGVNLYLYAGANGVNWTDPEGLYEIKKGTIEVLFGHHGEIDQKIENQNCSAGSAVCCWAGGGYDDNGNYKPPKNIENPIPGRTEPGNTTLTIAEAQKLALKDFEAGVKHAKTICNDPSKCCEEVTVKISCHFGWDIMGRLAVGAGICGKEEVVSCKRR